MDGTHIPIAAPRHLLHPQTFVSGRKTYHSINTQERAFKLTIKTSVGVDVLPLKDKLNFLLVDASGEGLLAMVTLKGYKISAMALKKLRNRQKSQILVKHRKNTPQLEVL